MNCCTQTLSVGQSGFSMKMLSVQFLNILLFTAYVSTQIIPSQDVFLSTLFGAPTETILNVAENFVFVPISDTDVTFLYYQPLNNKPVHITSETFKNYLNKTAETKLIIHGWDQNATADYVVKTASLYHQKGKYNVIAVDWSTQSSQNYLQASQAVQAVGYSTADFILAITQKWPNFPKRLHLIGHSLGAHIAGFAGKKVKEQTGNNKTISRITGNDVANPLFEFPILRPCEWRLCRTDALFVDLIHTDSGLYGVSGSYGSVDFYVNGGGPIQPNCVFASEPLLTGPIYCSHETSNFYYYQTILEPKKYKAVKCRYYWDYILGLCSGVTAYLGDEVNRTARGNYYIQIA